jgi:hypothetical protein
VEPVKDVSCGDAPLLVGVHKRRYTCTETRCPRKTFTEATEQLPSQARVTTRLATRVITALRAEPRAVSRVADETGLAWPTVMRLLAATVDLASGVDGRHVRRLGIDEHRFRTVKFVRDPDTAKVTRLEPWSIMFTGPDKAVKGHPAARAGVAVQDPHRLAARAADLLSHACDERAHRGGEPDRQDLQEDREGYRNHDNYRCRTIAYAPKPTAA